MTMKIDDDALRVSTINSCGIRVVKNGYRNEPNHIVGVISLILYRQASADYAMAAQRGITLWSLEQSLKELMLEGQKWK